MGSIVGSLTGENPSVVGTLNVSGVVTAPAGFVGPVTGSITGAAGNLTTVTSTTISATTANITAAAIGGVVTYAATSPAQITANVNDYVGFGSTPVSRISTDAARDCTGATGSSTQYQLIFNVGSFNLVFKHENAGSTAALRFSLKGAADYTLAPGACIARYYDATTARWRLTQP